MATKITSYDSMDKWINQKGEIDRSTFQPQSGPLKLPAPFNKEDSILEAQLQTQCMQYLKIATDIGWHVRLQINGQIRNTSTGMILTPSALTGLPDILFIRNDGILNGVELKRKGGHISRKQLNTLNELQDSGAKVWICTSIESFICIVKQSFTTKDFIRLEGIKIC